MVGADREEAIEVAAQNRRAIRFGEPERQTIRRTGERHLQQQRFFSELFEPPVFTVVRMSQPELLETFRFAIDQCAHTEPLGESFFIAGCGHMNTWGQQTSEYLAKCAELAQLAGARTLLIANPCAQRADRIALLMLTAAELPNFVRDNPPSSTAPASVLPLAGEARQFFLTGEPELADRYFPWLVNIMSPAYWVYLVMAVTVLFNLMRGYSKFRLWRIDAAREKLETAVKRLVA